MFAHVILPHRRLEIPEWLSIRCSVVDGSHPYLAHLLFRVIRETLWIGDQPAVYETKRPLDSFSHPFEFEEKTHVQLQWAALLRSRIVKMRVMSRASPISQDAGGTPKRSHLRHNGFQEVLLARLWKGTQDSRSGVPPRDSLPRGTVRLASFSEEHLCISRAPNHVKICNIN